MSMLIFLLGTVFLLFPVAHLRLVENVPIYLAEFPLLVVLITVFLTPHLRRALIQNWRNTQAISIGIFLFIGGAVSVFLLRDLPVHSLGLLKSFIVLPVIFMLLLSRVAQDRKLQKTLLWYWWLGILTSAITGGLLMLQGITTYDGRLASLYASPNQFAMLLSPGVLIGFWLSLQVPQWRWFFLLGTMLMVGMLFKTQSYAAMLALIASSLLFSLPFERSSSLFWKRTIFIGLLLVGAWACFEWPTEKFQSLINFEKRSSSASRVMIWEVALKISQDSFPWGIGVGRFQAMYLSYQKFFPPYLEWAVPEPHNLFLSLYLATGILGLAGFLLVVGAILRGLWQKTQDDDSLLLYKLYLSLISWFLLVGLVDTPYFKNDLTLALWGVLGLALGHILSQKEKPIN